MGRKIVLLSDGTGNSAAKVWRTNVWRIFESVDLSNSDQIAFYDDGVGTSTFKPLAILGGAFGYGLKRNVIDLYKFVCRNYRDDTDEIFGFGFSRGAFTIRIVVGLIVEQGLVAASSESELHAKATAAYRQFRRDNFHTNWPRFMRPEEIARRIRDLFARSDYDKTTNRHGATIRFLGLWDTVAAYGMPVDEMAIGISKWIWPWQLPDRVLAPVVKRACHALSIDDDRTTFHPVLWDERDEAPLQPRADGKYWLEDERISQVWFVGAHSNVGGGYPDDSVAQIPLVWIMGQAHACGLRFKVAADANPQTFGHPMTAQDKDGRIYDPRSGIGGYYRYGPRDLVDLGKESLSRQGGEALPRIHESVLARVHNYAHAYAPKGLPARYAIVTVGGEVVPPERNAREKQAQATARWHGQERVWNVIWWRRLVYFLTVLTSIYLFVFPLLRTLPRADEYESPLRWVSDLVRTAGQFLPDAADPWLNGYARAPGRFVIVVAVLVGLLLLGSRLAARIQDRMTQYWQRSLQGALSDEGPPQDIIFRLRNSAPSMAALIGLKKHLAPALFALLFVYLGLTLLSHVLFNIQDVGGFVCRETKPRPNPLEVNQIALASGQPVEPARASLKDIFATQTNLPVFKTSELCQGMPVWLQRGKRYRITLESTDSFFDDGIDASDGFYSSDPSSAWQKAAVMTAVPLRRELFHPWFRLVARIGGVGGEENFLDPDPSEPVYRISAPLHATRDGQLFLFVNDAVIGIPGLYGAFYKNNKGSTRVVITRTR
jgi:uncharacterized protein (DUF2235 family)